MESIPLIYTKKKDSEGVNFNLINYIEGDSEGVNLGLINDIERDSKGVNIGVYFNQMGILKELI